MTMVDRKVGRHGRIRLTARVTASEWRRLSGQPDVSPLIEHLALLSDRLLGVVIDEVGGRRAAGQCGAGPDQD